MRCKRVNSGFTLIELMVVLSLVAFAMMLVSVTTSFIQRSYLSADLNKLYTTCWYLHKRALATGDEQKLTFDVTRNSYTYDAITEKLSSGVIFGLKSGVKGPPATPKKVPSRPITFAGTTMTFHPDGIISAGTVYLTDSNRLRLYALSSGVGAVSFLRKYRYDNEWKPYKE